MELKLATLEQSIEICGLINSAYRGEEGWTRETDIVAGDRIKLQDIELLISSPDAHLFVCSQDEKIISCICIEKKKEKAFIGTFAVEPSFQGQGLGQKILSMAEAYAKDKLGVSQFVMLVVSQRDELISYYERRGYIRSGRFDEYPVHLDVGVPKVEGLTIEYLIKDA